MERSPILSASEGVIRLLGMLKRTLGVESDDGVHSGIVSSDLG
jgi:hypothetical protein